MKPPVLTVCNYVHVTGSYCYTATYVTKNIITYVLQTLYNVIIYVSTQTKEYKDCT